MMSSIDPGEQVKHALIGLARDIRGLAYSFNQKAPYMMFFEWIYPNYCPILIRAVEIWAHDPAVTTPVLKFFGEFVQNRSQRLVFGMFIFNYSKSILNDVFFRCLKSKWISSLS